METSFIFQNSLLINTRTETFLLFTTAVVLAYSTTTHCYRKETYIRTFFLTVCCHSVQSCIAATVHVSKTLLQLEAFLQLRLEAVAMHDRRNDSMSFKICLPVVTWTVITTCDRVLVFTCIGVQACAVVAGEGHRDAGNLRRYVSAWAHTGTRKWHHDAWSTMMISTDTRQNGVA